MRIFNNICRRRQNVLFLLPLFLMMASVLTPQYVWAEISVESYCQITILTMKERIPQTQALIAIVNQYKDQPETLKQQLDAKRAEFDQKIESLYHSYGTTAEEFVTYMNRNGKMVNAYLKSNPDIKQQIDELSEQLDMLLEQEGALE